MENNHKNQKIAQFQKELNDSAVQAFKLILDMWSDIGFSNDEIDSRCKMITHEFNAIYDNLVESEESLMNEIKTSLERYKREVKKLQEKLNVKLIDLNDTNNNKKNLDNLDSNMNKLKRDTILEETKIYKDLLISLENIKLERKQKLQNLKQKEKQLCDILDESEYSINDSSFIDENDLNNYEHHVVNLSFEKHKRIRLLKQFNDDINRLVHEYHLKINPQSSLNKLNDINSLNSNDLIEKIINHQIPIDTNHLNTYRASIGKLISKKDELIDSIDSLRFDITQLWTKFDLKTSDPCLEQLVGHTPSYNQDTFNQLYDEYTRCCESKQLKINTMIEAKRDQIQKLCDFCMFDQTRRDLLIKNHKNNNFDEDLLDQYEKHLKELLNYSKKYENLFNLIKEFNTQWNLFKMFEVKHSDPSRFHQRGYSSLNEQRERESLNSKLNKIKKQLSSECESYAQNEGKEFALNGLKLDEYIENLKLELDQEKENMRKDRKDQTSKNSKSKLYLTPQNQSVQRASIVCKSLSKVSTSSANLRLLSSSKCSISSATSQKSTKSKQLILTPSSVRTIKTSPKKLISDKENSKKSSIMSNLNVNKPVKRRSTTIKEINDKCKKNMRRSKIVGNIPEICVTDCNEFKNLNINLMNENMSILNTANILNSTSLSNESSSGVISGYLSINNSYAPNNIELNFHK